MKLFIYPVSLVISKINCGIHNELLTDHCSVLPGFHPEKMKKYNQCFFKNRLCLYSFFFWPATFIIYIVVNAFH